MDATNEQTHRCGRTDANGRSVVSWHRTSDGVLVWVRCACGALEARLLDGSWQSTLVARGGHCLPDRAGRTSASRAPRP
jgi:hypothetical protein